MPLIVLLSKVCNIYASVNADQRSEVKRKAKYYKYNPLLTFAFSNNILVKVYEIL